MQGSFHLATWLLGERRRRSAHPSTPPLPGSRPSLKLQWEWRLQADSIHETHRGSEQHPEQSCVCAYYRNDI